MRNGPLPRRTGERSRLTLGSGLVVHVVDTGVPSRPGPASAVLLLHGIGMSSSSLEPVASALAATHRAVGITLPGHGGSPRPQEDLSVEGYAEVAAEVADRLGIDRAVVVGQSMGAQFAIALARARPDLVAGLVLIGPVVDDRHYTALAQGMALALDSSRETVSGNLLVFRDYVRCGPRWFGATLRSMLAYPTLERARGLPMPAIVVRGAGDPIAGAEWVIRLSRAMGDARVVTLPGAHHAQLVVPQDVAELVRRVDRAARGTSDRPMSPRQGPARATETENDRSVTIHE
ncbi:alpha/beta fold hydrolase [Labedella endophytica]|uniref:Alpha/beta hydrolase n=1 Tax=Labedella endophytica TaxID=1523160 RepID=A0A3S0VD74_9MICO|nr:alpha/beta hydrolase [Labedella endophytica]RUR03280.1 alpha/beta hydrolase [Labedella endophytica]